MASVEAAVSAALLAQTVPQYRVAAAQLGALSTDVRVAAQLQHLGGTTAASRILLSTPDPTARRYAAFTLANITNCAGLSVAADGHGEHLLGMLKRGDVDDETRSYVAAACCNLMQCTRSAKCLGTDEAVAEVCSRLVNESSHVMLVTLAAAFIAEATQTKGIVLAIATDTTMLGNLVLAGMGPYHPAKVSILVALCNIGDCGAEAVDALLPLGVIDLVVACCVDTQLPVEALRYAAHLVAALARSPTHRMLVGKRTLGVLMRNLVLDDVETVAQCLQAIHVILEDSLAIDTFLQAGGLSTLLGIFAGQGLRGAWANALRVLAQICRSTGGAIAVVESEVATHIVQLYTDEESEHRSLAAIVVANIASFADLLPQLLALAAVEQLGACVLMHGATDDICVRSCLMVALQITANFAYHPAFLQQRGMAFQPTLLAAMAPDVRVLASGVVLNLARNPSTHGALCKSGIPAIIVNLLDDRSLQVQHAAVLACRALIQSPLACGALTGAGCFPALARCMRCDHPDAVMHDIIAVVGNLTADVRSHTRFLSHDLAIALLNITASPTVQDRSLQLAASTLSNLQLSEIGRALVLRCVTELAAGDDAVDYPAAAAVNVQRLNGDSLHCMMRVLVNLSATGGGARAIGQEGLIRVMAQNSDSSSITAAQLSLAFMFNLTLHECLDAMPVVWFADYLVNIAKLIRHRSTGTKMRVHALQLLALMLKAADVLEQDTVRYVVDSLSSTLSHEDPTLRTLSALCVLTAFKSSSAIDLFGSSSAASVAIATLCDIRDTSVMAVLASTFCVWSFSPALQKTLFATNPTSFAGFLVRSAVSLDARVQRLTAATIANLFEANAVPFVLMGHMACVLVALIDKGADAAVVSEALRGLAAATAKPGGITHLLMQAAGRITSVLMGPSATAAAQARRVCANLSAYLAADCFLREAKDRRTVLDYFRLAMAQSTPGDGCLLLYSANTAFVQLQAWPPDARPTDTLQVAAVLNGAWLTPPAKWTAVPVLVHALEYALQSDHYFLKVHALQCLRFLTDRSRELASTPMPGVPQLVAGLSAIQDGVKDGLLEVLANVSKQALASGGYFTDRTLRLAWHEVLTATSARRRHVALLMLANIASTEEVEQRRILVSLHVIHSAARVLEEVEQASQIALLRLLAGVVHSCVSFTAPEAVAALVPAILVFCKSMSMPLASAARLAEACLFDAFEGAIGYSDPFVLMECFTAVGNELTRGAINTPGIMRATSAFLAMGAAHPLFDRELNHGDIGVTLCRLITAALTDVDSSILLLQTLRRGVMLTGVVTLIDNEDFLGPVCKALAADSSSRELNREVAALVAQCSRARLMRTTELLTPTFLGRLVDTWTPRATDAVCDALWASWCADTLQRSASHVGMRRAGVPDELLAAVARMPVEQSGPFDDHSRLVWQTWRCAANMASLVKSADELFSMGMLRLALDRLQRLPSFVLLPAYGLAANLMLAPRSWLAISPRELVPLRNLAHIASKEFGSLATASLTNALHSVRDMTPNDFAVTLPSLQTALARRLEEGDVHGMLPLLNMSCDVESHGQVTAFRGAYFVRYMIDILRTPAGRQTDFVKIAAALGCSFVGRSAFFDTDLLSSLMKLAIGAGPADLKQEARMGWLNASAAEAAQLLRHHPLPFDLHWTDIRRLVTHGTDEAARWFGAMVMGNYRQSPAVYFSKQFVSLLHATMDVAVRSPTGVRVACVNALLNALVLARCPEPTMRAAVAAIGDRFDELVPVLRLTSLEALVSLLGKPSLRAAALPYAGAMLRRFADPNLPTAVRLSFYAAVSVSEPWRMAMAEVHEPLRPLLGTSPFSVVGNCLPPMVIDRAVQGHSLLVGAASSFTQALLSTSNTLTRMWMMPHGRLVLDDRAIRAVIDGRCITHMRRAQSAAAGTSSAAVVARMLHGYPLWTASAAVMCDEQLEAPVAAKVTTAYGRLLHLLEGHGGQWKDMLWWTDDPLLSIAKAAAAVDTPVPSPPKLGQLTPLDLVSMQPLRWSDGPASYRLPTLRAYGGNPIAGRRQFALMRAKQQRRLALACATHEARGGSANPLATLIAMHASRSHAVETSFVSISSVLDLVLGSVRMHQSVLRAVGFLPLRLIEHFISRPLRVKDVVASAGANGHDDVWNAAACAVARGTLMHIDRNAPTYKQFPTAAQHDPAGAAAQAIELSSILLQGVWGPQAVLALHTIMSGGLDHAVIDEWSRKIVHTTQAASTLMFAQCIRQLSQASVLAKLDGQDLVSSITLGRHLNWFPSPQHALHRVLHRPATAHAIAANPQNAFQALCLLLRLRRLDDGALLRDPAVRRVVCGALSWAPDIIPAHVFHTVSAQIARPLTTPGDGARRHEGALAAYIGFLSQLPTVVATQMTSPEELLRLRMELDVGDVWLLTQLASLMIVGNGVRKPVAEVAARLLRSPFAGDRIAAAESYVADIEAAASERAPITSATALVGGRRSSLLGVVVPGSSVDSGAERPSSKYRFGSLSLSVLLARLLRDVDRVVNNIGYAALIKASTAAPPCGDVALQQRQAALAYTWTTAETATAGLHAAGLVPLLLRRELDARMHNAALEATAVVECNPYAVRSTCVRHLLLLDRSFKTELEAITRPSQRRVLDRLSHVHPMFTVDNAADAAVSIVHMGSLAAALNLAGPEDDTAARHLPLVMHVAAQAFAFAAGEQDARLFDAAMHALYGRWRAPSFPVVLGSSHTDAIATGLVAPRRLVSWLWGESWRMRGVSYGRTVASGDLQYDAEVACDLILAHLHNLDRADYTFASPLSTEVREVISQALALGSGAVEDVVAVAVILLCRQWSHTFERYLVGRTQLAVFQAWVSAVVRKLRKAHFRSVPAAAAAIASLQRLLGVRWHGVASELYE